LLFRYGASVNGSIEKKAHIYTAAEHGIDPRSVDPDALWVVRRLRGARFHAYIVGGAVRDMLVGRTPKDFDIATDAHPLQIKRLFRSARVIGRRFRLVHVYCSREKYIEVSTFRSRVAPGTEIETPHPDANNAFGTMEEDARRRDFTINALYYCPVDQQLFDYVDAYPDLKHRRLKTLDRAEASFEEDPVRMIRAVKYASLLDFPFPAPLAGLVRRMRESVLSCSRERVTEEVYKILTSGASAAILELSDRLRLFEVMFPSHAASVRDARQHLADSPFGLRLKELDARQAEGSALPRQDMFEFLFHDLALARKDILDSPEPDFGLQQFIRGASAPLFPSKKDLAVAAEKILKEVQPHYRRGTRAAAARLPEGQAGERKKRRRRGRGRGRPPGSPPRPA
jgi:poly(A) polymerase